MTEPTTADVLQWKAWLAAAELAYHNLMTGTAAVEIAVDGSAYVTKFARPNAADLQAYITRLADKIASATSGCGFGGSAIGVIF